MAVVQLTGNDLTEQMRYSYTRDAHWKIGNIFNKQSGLQRNYNSTGILYSIQSLNNWFKLICDPQSKYHSNSTTLLNDIYDCMLSINNDLSTNILHLIIEFCCCPFYNYISVNSLINKISVNDDNRQRNEYAFNVLNNGQESWNKWYCGSYNRFSRAIPNHDVLIIVFYFDLKIVIDRYMIQTANDFDFRDPFKWILFGDNMDNINKNKNKILQNVIHHQNKNRRILSTARWFKNWFDIDTKRVYNDNGGYDTYILAVYQNNNMHMNMNNCREIQIGQIQFECADESKMFLYNQFDIKINKLINLFHKKGMAVQELQQYFDRKKVVINND